MEIEVKGLTNGNPYQRYQSADQEVRKLGRRELVDLTGSAYAFLALVRHGAYWHMYPLRLNNPGVSSVLELRRLWEGEEFRGFLQGFNWCAHAPKRRRVVLHVNAGHDLAVKDPSLFNKSKGSSDPYCKVYCGLFEETYEVKKKTLNPTWSYDQGPPQTLRAVSESDPRVFLVHVFDHDNNKPDDFMGCCYVPVAHAFTLPLGEHFINVALTPMGHDELSRIKQQHGIKEYNRHNTDNIRGYLTIELRSEEEHDATLYL